MPGKTKKTHASKKKQVQKPKVSWKALLSGLGLAAVVGAIVTTNTLISHNTQVLGATDSGKFNPCANTRCGTGPYCSGRCGAAGSTSGNALYYCSCPSSNPHCKNAYIFKYQNSCSAGCHYNPYGQDSCNKPSSSKPPTSSTSKVADLKVTPTCHITIHTSKTYSTSVNVGIGWSRVNFHSGEKVNITATLIFGKDTGTPQYLKDISGNYYTYNAGNYRDKTKNISVKVKVQPTKSSQYLEQTVACSYK